MSENRTFIFYPDWKECIDRLEKIEDKYALMKVIIDYGTTGEYQTDNNIAEAIFSSLIRTKIDMAQKNYTNKIENGENYGRQKKYNDDDIRSLGRQGKSAKDVAAALNISVDTVYHSEGWKNRYK